MPLTILSDKDVRAALNSLTKEDILDLQKTLNSSLHEYSTGTQEAGCCSANQPKYTKVSQNGQSTFFMPATATDMYGIKTVSVAQEVLTKFNEEVEAKMRHRSTGSIASKSSKSSIDSGISSKSSKSATDTASASTPTASSPAASIKTAATSPSTTPTTPDHALAKSFQKSVSVNHTSPIPNRSLTLLNAVGQPTALINANELTAFRTALASTLVFTRRSQVSTVTVFGAGKQAYWHIRLALILRGAEIKHINIVSRTFDRIQTLLQDFYGSEHTHVRGQTKFSSITPDFVDYERLLKLHVRKADAIFLCTPAIDPLFPPEYLTSSEARRKGRYIAAIGSLRPTMTELHPDVFRSAVKKSSRHDGHHIHLHKHAPSAGVIIVDSLETCMRDSGELIQAGITPDQCVEVGELLILKHAYVEERRRHEEKRAAIGENVRGEGVEDAQQAGGGKGMREWIEKGNVLYKSVGFALLDLVVGEQITQIARERGIGTTIDEF